MTVPELLYQRAIEAGFTIEAASALLANIQGESAFEPTTPKIVFMRLVLVTLSTFGGPIAEN